MLIRKAFKFRLRPNRKQKHLFAQFAGSCRYIYNWGLASRIEIYESSGITLSYFEQNNQLVRLKHEEGTAWLKEIHSQSLQQSLKDLDQAFKHFFRRLKTKEAAPGFPRFKSKGSHDSFRYPQGVKVSKDHVYLPKIGLVRFRKSREIQGIIKQTTIKLEGDRWYISFSCEIEVKDLTPSIPTATHAVGIDVGITQFATLAYGPDNQLQAIGHPHHLERYLPRLAKLSQELARKQKGSRNRLKCKRKLARLHARIRNQRNEFVHQLSTQIVKSHDVICVESLDVSKLLQEGSRSLSRAIADASWSCFLRFLKYKAAEKGKHLIEVGQYYPSTQLCSRCGNRQKLSLSERTYTCSKCELKLDRDYNAAINIKAAGTTALNACGANVVGVEAGISPL